MPPPRGSSVLASGNDRSDAGIAPCEQLPFFLIRKRISRFFIDFFQNSCYNNIWMTRLFAAALFVRCCIISKKEIKA